MPLCGKSLDMFWLAERFDVVGSELSDIACRDFFEEQDLTYIAEKSGEHCCYSVENITLYQGDFFKLSPPALGHFDWIYDRAALIAMPKAMQQAYVNKLVEFMSPNTRLFLITLEFPQEELEGPPFPVFQSDVARLFSDFNIEHLADKKIADKQFARRRFDVSYLIERVYLITNK